MVNCCISCGKFDKKYIYIFIATIFQILNSFTSGYAFDRESAYTIKFFDNGVFSRHIIINQMDSYLFCIILSCLLLIIEKQVNKRKKKNKFKRKVSLKKFLFLGDTTDSFVNDIKLNYRQTGKSNYTYLFIIFICFLYVTFEQILNIFSNLFLHLNFWMIELYIIAFLHLKMFKLEIYNHQKLTFYIIVFSIILNISLDVLTIVEGKEEKALYAKYQWTIIIGIVIYLLYATTLSYSLINIKKFIDLKFKSLYFILLIHGIIGFLFCLIYCLITTYIPYGTSDNIEENYIFKVIDEKNKTYIDNFKVYFNNFMNGNKKEVKNEIISSVLGCLSFSLYQLFSFKIIEELSPIHKIFSYPLFLFFRKIIFFSIRANKIFDDININKYYLPKFIIDLISDINAIIGYLIYLEIIELNFGQFNYNLRKSILLREREESINNLFPPEDEDINDENDENEEQDNKQKEHNGKNGIIEMGEMKDNNEDKESERNPSISSFY